MARKTIIVCDVCESASGVRAWEIKDDKGRKKKVELCLTHSTPLARVFEDNNTSDRTPEAAPVTPAPRRRRGSTPVVEA